jgi:polyisoprenoid-binding protein YceI
MVRVLTTVALLGLVPTLSRAQETKYALNGDNTKITFVGSKDQGKHDGGFKTVTGSAAVNGTDPTTLSLKVDIDMNTLFADNPMLTRHLKSPDFFDVKNNPDAKFVSTKVEKKDDKYSVTGKLTMHGKTKELSFPATIEAGNNLTIAADFTINRHDWGISFGKGKVHDDVKLKVRVNAAK